MADLNNTLIRGSLRVTNSIISNSETLNGHLYYSDVYHRISQEDGSTITRAGGGTISLPVGSGSKGIAILTDEGSDYGLLYVGSDGCTIHNSGDNGYLFSTVDKDTGTTMFGIGQSGTSSFFSGGLIINGVLDLKNTYLRFQDSNGYEIGTIRTLQDSDHNNVYRPYYMYSDAVTDFIALRSDLNSYLPISGGTLNNTGSDTPLYLQGNSGSTYLGFKNSSGTVLGYFYVNSSNKPGFFYNGTGTEISLDGHTHSYLPLSGGTLTGHLTMDTGKYITLSGAGINFTGTTQPTYTSGRVTCVSNRLYMGTDGTQAGVKTIAFTNDSPASVTKNSSNTDPGNTKLAFWSGNQSEYNQLTKNNNTVYFIT